MRRFAVRGGPAVAISVVASLVGATLFLLPGGSASETPPRKAASVSSKTGRKAEAPERGGARSEDAAIVYTNEDLERMFGSPELPSAPTSTPAEDSEASEPREAPAPREPTVDPLELLRQREHERQAQAMRIAAAEKEVEAAETAVRELSERLRSLNNPYLPPPRFSEEERRALRGKDQAERVNLTQGELESARRELERARRQLERLRSGS